MKRLGGIVLASFLAIANLHASSGTEGAAFLDIPVGAGPAAMGSAYAALATDAYAPIYNPAGLGFLSGTQFAGQHLSYLESIHDEYLGFVHPVAEGKAVGISAQYLGTGDINATGPNSGEPLGSYSSHYGAYALSYGQKLTSRLALGLTGKWINAKLADVSADAYAFDLGSFYQANRKLNLALTINQIGSKLTFSSHGDPLPLAVHAGGAYRPFQHWDLAFEGVFSQTGLWSGRMGLEWTPIDMLKLRTGYKTDTVKELGALAGFTVGMGLKLWGQELAYAWLPYGDLGDTQYISLLVRFGKDREETQNLIQYQNIKEHQAANDSEDSENIQMMELLGAPKQPVAQTPDVKEPAR